MKKICIGCNGPMSQYPALSRYKHGNICSDCGVREALTGDFISPKYCPRCIEEWEDDNGKPHKGTKKKSACKSCGVCKDCEHLMECNSNHK